jgi:hypothetical protein
MALRALRWEADPAAFVAVTSEYNLEPTSAAVTAYACPFAPEIVTQPLPLPSQRRHAKAKLRGTVPVQLPLDDVSVLPSRATPERTGHAEFTG